MKPRILIVEPYYGGSHKLFLTGLQNTIEADFTLLTLPARKWKNRMQLAAFWCVNEIQKIPLENRNFDTVLCSTFVDVAVLRGMLHSVSGWNQNARIITYFHENQFAYPGQIKDPTIRQFTAINFTTAMASDLCAFNSHYNLESFLNGVRVSLKKSSDIKLTECVTEIRKKSRVLYPGMEYSLIDREYATGKRDISATASVPIILWNHRWEHDKGPEMFFDALYYLQEKNVQFGLVVMGESFANKPECFAEAAVRLQKEIIHFGYAESREEYVENLCRSDLIVSTAKHEFFGISVLEAVRAGCCPLLPDDLSYPELYGSNYLYKRGKLRKSLLDKCVDGIQLKNEQRDNLTDSFDWKNCKKSYENFLI